MSIEVLLLSIKFDIIERGTVVVVPLVRVIVYNASSLVVEAGTAETYPLVDPVLDGMETAVPIGKSSLMALSQSSE